ncbi:hypothetical protein Sru01_27740 [Sphaerisporangium rufum]|uniref:Histidine kinase/HSP90-like ATPase domain-containing protein n=1 Tax=Sphaerisporangium rufum TaxID=1381558 RepID=A0A919R174_9ACTN|nr:ATP-binding protein [Sphaerisporangium rufum]GII77792.1 hypothetical protein Sru01_27740 [Sphaerisporangium rufum]
MSETPRRIETADFPATETSVAEARRWLRKILDGRPRCDDAVLLLSEAATNSVVYTDTATIGVTVTVEENGDVRVEVADEGAPTIPSLAGDPEDLKSSGRGILLIRALATRWGFTANPPAHTLWFELSPAPATRQAAHRTPEGAR